MDHFTTSLGNATSFLPSSMDILMAVPRLLHRAGALADHMDGIFGKLRYGGSIIAQPTPSNVSNATVVTSAAGRFIQESLAATARTTMAAQDDGNTMPPLLTMKNIGSFFNYMTSKWAIATFATAILLNRTHFYASSRVPLAFNRWYLRLALYIIPTVIFTSRIHGILQAIRCQTFPGWSLIQYGAPGKQLDIDFAGESGFLYTASSTLLFWEDVESSCKAANMLPLDPGLPRATGSLSLLWPLFLSLGFSQFIETLFCALQNRQPLPETGMTIFEHSLAFAEAEVVVTKPLSFDTARFSKPVMITTPDGTAHTLTRNAIAQFANVPPEVLLIALISSVSHLISNILAITGLRARFRLITTGLGGVAYLSAFLWSFSRAASAVAQQGHSFGIIRFPTVCIVSFIPHLLILVGIAVCGLIYALAFILTVISPPLGQMETGSLKERISIAYGNLQANIHFSAINPLRINWQEDFYTAILKCGFTILTSASEAVYLNEGTRVNVAPMTWLEKKRLQEILARRAMVQQTLEFLPPELRGESVANGVAVLDRTPSGTQLHQYATSGYGRERKARGDNVSSDSRAVVRDTGVGLQQRRGRWILTYHFLSGIFRLILAIQAKITITVMSYIHIPFRPRWLENLAGPEIVTKPRVEDFPALFRMTQPQDSTTAALMNNGDVETAVRRRLEEAGFFQEHNAQESEDSLTNTLYSWWRSGGWWGEEDSSGDYAPPFEDDDTTSVVSMAPSEEERWLDLDSADEGQRTPTQRMPYPYSRESTPVSETLIDMSRLSHLLDPKSPEEKEEARLLAHHLRNEGIMTRSQYRRVLERDQARVLTSSRLPLTGGFVRSPEEEEAVLEQFILEQRRKMSIDSKKTGATWNTGAEGMGSEGPQCVVCQLSPRTVLVWPCGCLSLCDDCRVGLASKNYTTCVCCRTDVVAYSRLYVP